jgi:hypothetical protein
MSICLILLIWHSSGYDYELPRLLPRTKSAAPAGDRHIPSSLRQSTVYKTTDIVRTTPGELSTHAFSKHHSTSAQLLASNPGLWFPARHSGGVIRLRAASSAASSAAQAAAQASGVRPDNLGGESCCSCATNSAAEAAAQAGSFQQSMIEQHVVQQASLLVWCLYLVQNTGHKTQVAYDGAVMAARCNPAPDTPP